MSARIVLDASAAMGALLGRPRAISTLDLLERSELVAVPDLFFAEVANALWKYVRAGEMDPHEAQHLLELATGMADETVPAQELAAEALDTTAAFGHPVYDALCAVLARRRGAAVCTMDRRLAELLKAMRIPTVEEDDPVG